MKNRPIINREVLELLPEELRHTSINDIWQGLYYDNILLKPFRTILEKKIGIWDIPGEHHNETLNELTKPAYSSLEDNEHEGV